MELSELIRTRRSVYPKSFNDLPIADKLIEEMLEAARWAPTHRKTQPWRFVVIRSEARDRLADAIGKAYSNTAHKFSQITHDKLRSNATKSQVVIAICMKRDLKESLPEWEEVAAVAMAVQNLWLSSHEKGIGGYWSSPGVVQHLGDFLELKEGERCYGLFYMGYYDEKPEDSKRLPLPEIVRYFDR
jgi:nitroreductase